MEILKGLGIIVICGLGLWGAVRLIRLTKNQRRSSVLQAVLPETRRAKRNK